MKRLVLLLLCSNIGCLWGTGTGNPLTARQGAPASFSTDRALTSRLVFGICSAIFNCHSTSEPEECSQRIAVLDGLPSRFSAFENTDHMLSVRELELSGEIKPSLQMIDLCLEEIGAFSCDSLEMSEAFAPQSVAIYGGVLKLIPQEVSACRQIY